MSDYVTLKPAQRPTVAAVGEHAYKAALRRVPTGTVMLEVVPEPDNPHDNRAISVRHNGNVIAYIPRERTSTYWPVVARVAASGKIAQVKGRVAGNPDYDFYEVSLYLLASDDALAGQTGLVKKSREYDVPDAYGLRRVPPTSGVTFSQSEIDAEIARRRRDNPTHDARSKQEPSKPQKSSSDTESAVTVIVGAIIVVFLLALIF